MLRDKPIYTYNGLTVILSNPSRLDKSKLLEGGGGGLFADALVPHTTRYACDIRVKEDLTPLLEGTKCILLCGEGAARLWCRDPELTIGAARGSVFMYDGKFTGQKEVIPMIPTFFPQDCVDIKNYEAEFNKQDEGAEVEEDDEEGADPKRRHGKTARRNYSFWFRKDICKANTVCTSGIPKRRFEPNYIITPPAEKLIEVLSAARGRKLFIDLETWIHDLSIQCIGFSFDDESDIYVYPVHSYDYTWSYHLFPNITKAFAMACQRNTVIAHNGANFDFPVLAWRYHIPVSRNCEDTMIMQHRAFPDVEKSLGHFTSLWTWEPFHKDMGDGGYHNWDQMYARMQYCGKDVYTMKLGYYGLIEYAKKRPGLTESMQQGNRAIVPYMVTMLQGFRIDENMLRATMAENDRLMMHYYKIINRLVGEHNLPAIAGKSKAPLPASNTQCVRYFHDMLGYPVVAKGKERSDGSKGASLGKKAMLRLRLKHDNPVIDFTLAYREVAKESGSLKFTTFDFNNRSMNQKPAFEPTQQEQQKELALQEHANYNPLTNGPTFK